jgi:hypothetical protein
MAEVLIETPVEVREEPVGFHPRQQGSGLEQGRRRHEPAALDRTQFRRRYDRKLWIVEPVTTAAYPPA